MKHFLLVVLSILAVGGNEQVRAGEPQYNGEFYITLSPGETGDISVQAASSIWGAYSDGFPVTTSYGGTSVMGKTGLAFDNCDDWNTNQFAIAYALYLVTVTYDGSTHYIYVDWRDCDYPTRTNYVSGDVHVEFNVYTTAWKVNGTSVAEQSVSSIWGQAAGIKSVHSQNTSAFQPTDPSNLEITEDANQHPYLAWTPSEPTASAKYKVYRNDVCITVSAISNAYYTDTERLWGGASSSTYKIQGVSGDGTKTSPGYSNTYTIDTHNSNQEHPELVQRAMPASLRLQAFPNPFNPTTKLDYEIAVPGHVTMKIYNTLGVEVASLVNEMKAAGRYSASFDGTKHPSGIYYCVMTTGAGSTSKKLVLLK